MAISIPTRATWYQAGPTHTCNGRPCGTHGSCGQKLVGRWAAWPTSMGCSQLCGKSIRVTYKGKSISVPVWDCNAGDSLDLSLDAFRALADPALGVLSGIKVEAPGASAGTGAGAGGKKADPCKGAPKEPRWPTCAQPVDRDYLRGFTFGWLIAPADNSVSGKFSVEAMNAITAEFHSKLDASCGAAAVDVFVPHFVAWARAYAPCYATKFDPIDIGKVGQDVFGGGIGDLIAGLFNALFGVGTWIRVVLVIAGLALGAFVIYSLLSPELEETAGRVIGAKKG